MTKKEMYNALLNVEAVAANEEMVTFINHEIDLLNARKSSGNTKKKEESDARMEAVFEALSSMDADKATVSEIITKATNEVADYTNQRVSALLRKLVLAERVVKTIEGKKAYFAVAG